MERTQEGKWVVRARIAVAILLGILAVIVAFDVVTASPLVCSSCHEIVPRSESWEQSAHSGVSCVMCHTNPAEGLRRPLRLADRALLLGRDTIRHLSGRYDDPVDGPVPGVAPMDDAVCLQCHEPNRKATSGFRILIDHVEHAERNGSCVSCHVRTAHPAEGRGTALSLMAQCFTCHGTAEKPEASAECTVCHPSDYELLPVSHGPAAWAADHGEVAKADMAQCRMCHEQALCDDCHGLEMPHPDGWARGETDHAAAARVSRETCGRCHGFRPDMCTICHHEGYVPTEGPWVQQHPSEATEKGAASCLACHAPTFCIRCHTAGG